MSSLFWVVTQRMLVVVERHFGISYRSTWPLKMGSIGCPETSINNYQHTLHNNSEELRINVYNSICVRLLAFFRTQCCSGEEWRASSKDIYPEAVVTMTPFYWPCWGRDRLTVRPSLRCSRLATCYRAGAVAAVRGQGRTEQCQSAGSRNPTASSGPETPHWPRLWEIRG